MRSLRLLLFPPVVTLLLMVITDSSAQVSRRVPHFFFAGQSNMEGIVENGVNNPRFDTTMDILLSSKSGDDASLLEDLKTHLATLHSIPSTPEGVYYYEASELLRLKKEGLLNRGFLQPFKSVDCSFYRFEDGIDYTVDGQHPQEVAVDQPLSIDGTCGSIFGPELSFGRMMKKTSQYKYTDKLSIVKIGSNESEIYNHWSKDNGDYWDDIKERVSSIDSANDEWTAIVWFQGEADALNQDNAEGYLGNLTKFISDLREEMFAADSTTYISASKIPVAIVGMGCWTSNDPSTTQSADLITQAQHDFVSNDPHSFFVPTDDLSCNSHYDDASQLIIGERVGRALLHLLPEPVLVAPFNVFQPIEPVDSEEPVVNSEPDWWTVLKGTFVQPSQPLQSCPKRDTPPTDGTMCGTKSKSCFWGNQVCDSPTVSYPTTACVCVMGGLRRGTWSCESITCPAM